jgi:hypothetical protein
VDLSNLPKNMTIEEAETLIKSFLTDNEEVYFACGAKHGFSKGFLVCTSRGVYFIHPETTSKNKFILNSEITYVEFMLTTIFFNNQNHKLHDFVVKKNDLAKVKKILPAMQLKQDTTWKQTRSLIDEVRNKSKSHPIIKETSIEKEVGEDSDPRIDGSAQGPRRLDI